MTEEGPIGVDGLDLRPDYHIAPSADLPGLYDHLLRLGPKSRYNRFCHQVRDEVIEAYCRKCGASRGFVLCASSGHWLRGAAEIHLLPGIWPLQGELALSVEDAWQDSGIGSDLLALALFTARNYGVSRVQMICLAENRRMRHVAKKFHAGLTSQAHEVQAVFEPLNPIYQDLGTEGCHLPVPLHS